MNRDGINFIDKAGGWWTTRQTWEFTEEGVLALIALVAQAEREKFIRLCEQELATNDEFMRMIWAIRDGALDQP